MWYEWVFDGIGSQIVGVIIGFIIGGISGYRIGIKRNYLQVQMGKEKSKMKQIAEIENVGIEKEGERVESIRQFQKAGDESEQTQIGRIR